MRVIRLGTVVYFVELVFVFMSLACECLFYIK